MRYTASFDFSDIDTDLPMKKWEVINEHRRGEYFAIIYSGDLSFAFGSDKDCGYITVCCMIKDKFDERLYFNCEESISYYYLADEKDKNEALKLIAKLYDLYLEHNSIANKTALH